MASSPIATMASQVNKAFTDVFFPAILRRDTEVVGSGDSIEFVTATHSCKALVETYSMSLRADGLVAENERKIMILAGSISVMPKVGDVITVNGGQEFMVLEVSTDPATAIWTCRGRM